MNFERALQSYLMADAVEEMEFTKVADGVTLITAHLKDGNVLSYTDQVNWGCTLTEFYDKLDYFTNGLTYTFSGFDPQEEIEREEEKLGNFYGDY